MAWVSAVILALLPIVVAADFGGVLWWTQSIAGIAVLIAAGLAIPSVLWDGNVRFLRQHYLVLILFFWWAYSWLQTVPMFGGLVGTLSRGTGLAYRDWIKPYMGDEGAPTFYPISIDPEQSAHAVAMLAIVLCIVWTATQVFVSRPKIGMLLNVLAIGAALHAAFGIVRQVYPEVQVFGVDNEAELIWEFCQPKQRSPDDEPWAWSQSGSTRMEARCANRLGGQRSELRIQRYLIAVE